MLRLEESERVWVGRRTRWRLTRRRDASRVSRGVLCCPSNPTTTNNNRAQAVREIAGCCCAKMEAYQSKLATDVAHGDAA